MNSYVLNVHAHSDAEFAYLEILSTARHCHTSQPNPLWSLTDPCWIFTAPDNKHRFSLVESCRDSNMQMFGYLLNFKQLHLIWHLIWHVLTWQRFMMIHLCVILCHHNTTLWIFLTFSGWCLGHPSEKYEFVNWDDDRNPIYGKIKQGNQTTNQFWSKPKSAADSQPGPPPALAPDSCSSRRRAKLRKLRGNCTRSLRLRPGIRSGIPWRFYGVFFSACLCIMV